MEALDFPGQPAAGCDGHRRCEGAHAGQVTDML